MNTEAQTIFLGIIMILIIIVIVILLFVFRFPSEDSWIKDSRGVYVKHGHPLVTPDYVQKQQVAIDYAIRIYNMEKSKSVEFSSQCLGSSGDYAVDVVNVPRTSADDLPENQCEDYKNGSVKHFIEIDYSGNIIRIV